MAVSKKVKGCHPARSEIKWHVKRERGLVLDNRWEAEIDQRSLPTCQGTGSSSWSQVTGGNPACQAFVSVWLESLMPVLSHILPRFWFWCVYICSCYANWMCQIKDWGNEKGGISLRHAKKELISPSHAVGQACAIVPTAHYRKCGWCCKMV